jgi:hypothetical protein
MGKQWKTGYLLDPELCAGTRVGQEFYKRVNHIFSPVLSRSVASISARMLIGPLPVQMFVCPTDLDNGPWQPTVTTDRDKRQCVLIRLTVANANVLWDPMERLATGL